MNGLVRKTVAGVKSLFAEALLMCLPTDLVCRGRKTLGPIDLEGVVQRARRHKGPVVVGTTF